MPIGKKFGAMLRNGIGPLLISHRYNPSTTNTDQNSLIKFIYENSNKYGSTLKIEGTAQGNDIEGTAEWTDDNGLHKYTFTGVLL